MLRVALFCEESAGAQTLRMLASGPYQIAAVLTSVPAERHPNGVVWRLAEKLGYRPMPATVVRESGFAEELAALDVDLILNVHSLHIVPEAVLRVPRFGAYNLHPGPLPAFAGLNAPSWAIYLGHAEHAVTLHLMEPGIDTGPVVYEERFAIAAEDNGLSVSLRCVQKGLPLVARLLETICGTGRRPPMTRQDAVGRSYFGRQPPHTGLLPWNLPARRIHAFVRACDYHPFPSPWGVPRALLGQRQMEILRTRLTGQRCPEAPGTVRQGAQAGEMRVATADEWLEIRRCRPCAGVEPSPSATLHAVPDETS